MTSAACERSQVRVLRGSGNRKVATVQYVYLIVKVLCELCALWYVCLAWS